MNVSEKGTRELLDSALRTIGFGRWAGAWKRGWGSFGCRVPGLNGGRGGGRSQVPRAPPLEVAPAPPRRCRRRRRRSAPPPGSRRRVGVPGPAQGCGQRHSRASLGGREGRTARPRPRRFRAPSWFSQNFENRRTPIT